jgi:mRNA interferase RelE/StbE
MAAVANLSALTRNDVRQIPRIVAAVEALERDFSGDVRKLAGVGNRWRLRVGNWRVRFQLDGDQIYILSVLNRRDAYDD